MLLRKISSALLLAALFVTSAHAEDTPPLPSRIVYGLQFAYGQENDFPHNSANSHINMVYAQPQIGFIAWDSPQSRLPMTRFEVISEGILGGSPHPGGRLVGNTLLFRFDGKPIRSVIPFVDLGSGPLNTTINDNGASELGGHVQFLSQGGFGIEHKRYVFEWRYFHMSNAGLTKPNHGFNGNIVTVGMRWSKRR